MSDVVGNSPMQYLDKIAFCGGRPEGEPYRGIFVRAKRMHHVAGECQYFYFHCGGKSCVR